MLSLAMLQQLFRQFSKPTPAQETAASQVTPENVKGLSASPANGSSPRQAEVVSPLRAEPVQDERRGDPAPSEQPSVSLSRLMAGYFGARTEEALAPLFDTLARSMAEEVASVVRTAHDSLAVDLAGLRESATATQRECSRMGRELMRAGGTVDEMVANHAQLAAMLRRLETDLRGERDNARDIAAEIREAVWSETLGDLLATLDGLEAALEEASAISSALAGVARQIDDPSVRRWWRAMSEASGIKRQLPSIPAADLESWIRGMEITHRRLRDALIRRGVMVVEAIGQPFDPHWHEAVAVEPCSPDRDGTVLRVELNGYRRVDEVVRLAQVVVGKAEPAVEPIRRRRKEASSQLGAADEGGSRGFEDEIGTAVDGDRMIGRDVS